MRRRLATILIALGCMALGAALFPRWLCGRPAAGYFEGAIGTQTALGDSVAAAVNDHRGLEFYASPYSRFNGQSAIAIYQMTLLGLGQIVLDHPELRSRYLPVMQRAAERLANPHALGYAARVYGHHGVVQMNPGEGHAYLGYVNLGLGMLRMVDPTTSLAPLHDRLTRELGERLERSPTGLIETYPDETWPPDVAAVAGSIGLHGRATRQDHSAMLSRWSQRFEACARHRSGYLIQRVASGSCRPLDGPRGSGTAVAAYFLTFAQPELARRLYQSLLTNGRVSWGGFGGVREHLPGQGGSWDVNAGPEVFGISTGATGFALGAARAHGDRDFFFELYRTAHLFGVPTVAEGGTRFAVGGVLGSALLLAMLTAGTP